MEQKKGRNELKELRQVWKSNGLQVENGDECLVGTSVLHSNSNFATLQQVTRLDCFYLHVTQLHKFIGLHDTTNRLVTISCVSLTLIKSNFWIMMVASYFGCKSLFSCVSFKSALDQSACCIADGHAHVEFKFRTSLSSSAIGIGARNRTPGTVLRVRRYAPTTVDTITASKHKCYSKVFNN